MSIEVVDQLDTVPAGVWNELAGDAYPFTRHEFLATLERTGCVSPATGWQPQHLLVKRDNRVVAAMPLYLKHHSAGEYVFDYQWAYAYERHGLAYYPKWLTSIPFTPCQGPRVLTAPDIDADEVMDEILDYIATRSQQQRVSSWHLLFPQPRSMQALASRGLGVRQGVQFQWFNKGYRDFQDFLDTFSSKKRKNIKRERRRVPEQGIRMQRVPGNEVTEEQWHVFYQFYVATYLKRGMEPYLNQQCFLELARLMGDRLLMVLAEHEGRYVGAALSVVGQDALYGRYWGCFEDYNSLHFEACYYQGLDYCLENSLDRFDSGAQGQHKIARGFEPVTTYSVHWIRDPRFREAIMDFLERERLGVDMYKAEAETLLPFRQTSDS